MSLGWQCESALVPRKGNPIKLNDQGKSMMGLKAIVHNKVQTIQKNKELSSSTSGLSNSADIRRQNLKSKKADNLSSSSSRKSSKNSKDKDKDGRDDEEDMATKAYLALQKKAQIYEALRNGEKVAVDKSMTENCLVAFSESDGEGLSSQSRNNDSEHCSSSSVHPGTYFIREGSGESNIESTRRDPGASSSGQEFTYGGLNPYLAPSQARVKSQWERSTHARQHLESVHQDTIKARAQHSLDNGAVAADKEAAEGNGKSRLEARLEMLEKRRKLALDLGSS